jgi:urea transport system permease protein
MEVWLTQIFNGLSVSSILLLIALGLAITFGLMRVINMAHGEFIMIGAYGAYMTQEIFKSYLPKSIFDAFFPVAIVVSFGIAFAIGY